MNERLGVVVIPRTASGEVLLLPQLDENAGKFEMVIGFHTTYLPVEGLEFPAGAVEDHDKEPDSIYSQIVLAAMRESAEEAGFIGNLSKMKELSGNLRIQQLREGQEVSFVVYAFELLLTADQENWLIDHVGATKASSELISNVRPRDQAVLQKLSFLQELPQLSVTVGEERAYV
jgi:hypothetical protein